MARKEQMHVETGVSLSVWSMIQTLLEADIHIVRGLNRVFSEKLGQFGIKPDESKAVASVPGGASVCSNQKGLYRWLDSVTDEKDRKGRLKYQKSIDLIVAFHATASKRGK